LNVEISALSERERIHYSSELKVARERAYADGEGFAPVVHVMEALGRRLGNGRGLGDHVPVLTNRVPVHNHDFAPLARAVVWQRNAAVHTGSLARNLTQNCVRMALILEEGLMAEVQRTVENFMVRSVVMAEGWHTLDTVRLMMLEHGFSVLPVFWRNKWRYISEESVANALLSLSKREAEDFRRRPVQRLLADRKLSTAVAPLSYPTDPLTTLVFKRGLPHVVRDPEHGERLLGIVAPSDVM
jgi:hypothetical protein